MLTRQQALNLLHGDHLHVNGCLKTIGPRGGVKIKIEVWRVNGAIKIWKTSDRFRIPIKFGFSGPYSYITEHNLNQFHLAGDCPLNQ